MATTTPAASAAAIAPPPDASQTPPAQPAEPSATAAAPAPEAAPAPQPSSTALAAPIPQVVIPFHPTDVVSMNRLARFLADSNLVPKALQRQPNDVLVVLLKGHDLGLTPMQSIAGINVIDGKAEVGAVTMVSMILKSGLCEYWEPVFDESNATQAVYITKRRGARREARFVYTVEDARAAGLLDKGKDAYAKARQPWNAQRPTMLRRRCQSSLAREIYPDICAGLYDHDELAELHALEFAIIKTELTAQRDASADVVPDWMAGGIIPADSTEVSADQAPRDPLKERLRARKAQAANGGEPALYTCGRCGAPVVTSPTELCSACKNS